MPTATLEALEQRLNAMEHEIAQLRKDRMPLLPLTGRPNSRERLLAALENITPISHEDADLSNHALQEARERSLADNLPS